MTSDLFFKTFDPIGVARARYSAILLVNQIRFEKTERDCNHNRGIRDRKLNSCKLIYDYRVIINGDHRATFHKKVHSAGYWLQTPQGESIFVRGNGIFTVTDTTVFSGYKHQFLTHVCGAISHERIPTLVQLANIEADKKKELKKEISARANAENATKILRHARELYNLVKLAADGKGLGLTPAYEVACAKLIKKIAVK